MTTAVKVQMTFEEANLVVEALDLFASASRFGPEGSRFNVWNLARRIEVEALENKAIVLEATGEQDD